MREALIVGAGIGGLGAALACAQAGIRVRVIEKSTAFGEIGAGIQLGPNATRLLSQWGVLPDVLNICAQPQAVVARSSTSAKPLGLFDLQAAAQRYGSPYITVHRAGLHGVLAQAAQRAGIAVELDTPFRAEHLQAPLVVGADGIWSAVRQAVLRDGVATPTGHWAWRALLSLSAVPVDMRQVVTVWLGPHHHVVTYPIDAERLNVVAFTPGNNDPDGAQSWAQSQSTAQLMSAVGQIHPQLAQMLRSADAVSRWRVFERAPLRAAQQMFALKGECCVALLGDAAHPMRPYVAQGAGMALEDAAALAAALQKNESPSQAVAAYAQARWQRNARVQAKAKRNGAVFHATGPLAWARNLAMAMSPQVMDMPWLYGFDSGSSQV